MSSSISPIGVSSQSIGNAFGFGLRPRGKNNEQKAEITQQQAPPQQSTVSANDVLGYMAQAATFSSPVAAPKTINPANYVDAQSSARISQSMKDFETLVQQNFNSITQEFPEISDKTAYALAAKMLEEAA